MVENEKHVRITSSVVDISFGVKGKEIFMPDIGGKCTQFSFREDGHAIGILRIDTDEKFNEFFEFLKKSTLYEDFDKMDFSKFKAL